MHPYPYKNPKDGKWLPGNDLIESVDRARTPERLQQVKERECSTPDGGTDSYRIGFGRLSRVILKTSSCGRHGRGLSAIDTRLSRTVAIKTTREQFNAASSVRPE